MATAVAPLGPAGVYKIGYRIISADGHPVSGEVSFTLTTAGTGTPPALSAERRRRLQRRAGSQVHLGGHRDLSRRGVPVWVWVLGAVILLAIGLFFGLRTPRAGTRRG